MTPLPAMAGEGVMAYREVTVIEIKEVLRLWRRRVPKKRIAAQLGVDPKTVRRYVRAAEDAGLGVAAGPGENSWTADGASVCSAAIQGATPQPDVACPPTSFPQAATAPPTIDVSDEEVALVVARLHVPVSRERGVSWAACVERRDFIGKHLANRVRLSKIRRLLARESVAIPYATLHRFAVAELGFGRSAPTIPVVEGEPGDELQVDTGWVGSLEPDEKGHRRRFRAWIFTPAVSRYRFVWPCFQETTASAIEACEAAWAFYGGVFHVLLPDNTKAIVAEPNPLEPKFTRAFLEYAQARGFEIDPARARRPRDKARVERSVRDVRDDAFAGERITTIEGARVRGHHWCAEEYGRRPHTRTRRAPQEYFLAEEKPVLYTAPTEAYDVPIWAEPKVHRDQHAQIAHGLYSLPRRLVGRTLTARADSKIVRFYDGPTVVKVHPRVGKGQRSTDRSDFPAAQAVYAFRDASYLTTEAAKHGSAVGAFARELLAGPAPWRRMRQAYALLRLAERFGGTRVDDACRLLLESKAINIRLLENVVRQGGSAPVTTLSFVRDSGGPAGLQDRRSRDPSTSDTPARVVAIAKFLRPTSDFALARSVTPTKEETK